MRVLGVIALAFALSTGAASARPSADPGVSSGEIVIGGTVPLSGIAASYASVGRGAEAYFKYVNARGGVNRRKITYKYVDDQYNPAQTVQAVRQLVQQDDYGKDLLAGFKTGLGAKRRNLVAEQSYDPLSTDVSSQIARLRSSRATVLLLITTPPFAIRGLVAANRLGWRPQVYVNQVGSATNIMRIISATANPRIIEGAITLISVKDPLMPRFKNDAGMKLYKSIMRQHLPRGDVNDGFHVYAMAVAYTFVEALKKVGRNPTRASVVRAVANLNLRNNPFLLPGVTVKTSATDHFPLDQGQLQRWSKNQWNPLGKVISAR